MSISSEQEQHSQTVPHMMSCLTHRVNYSLSLVPQTNSNCAFDDRNKPLPSVSKNRHFPSFFDSKIMNFSEKNDKRSISLDGKLNSLFDLYKDSEDENLILMDGVEKLCSDLNFRPDDFKILIFAWKLNVEQMYQFTRQEFINGCKLLDAENISQIHNRLFELSLQLKNDPQQFRSLYKFTFKFGLDRANGQRILPVDMAVCLWRLVFTLNKPPILERWLLFLQNDKTHVRGIPRDTWNMFLNFCETIGNNLSAYNDAEAWPSIFDDFVEYENDRINQNIFLSEVTDPI